MQTLRTTARPIPTPRRWNIGLVFKRLLDTLAAADAGYRERRKMHRLTGEQLRDMGLTRDDAERGARWTAPAHWYR